MRTAIRTRLRPMTAEDIPQVMDIERESFPSMWPQTAYRRELQNKLARYIVLAEVPPEEQPAATAPGVWGAIRRIVSGEDDSRERLLGFIGLWLMVGEAHIVTVAVRESHRRMGIGERLLIAAVELAAVAGEDVVTLEVRKSNEAAQRLYAKYGFERVGLRVRYYTDNDEDAVLMTTPALDAPSFRARLEELRELHRQRNPDLWP